MLLLLPLLGGQIPEHPAGLPLALITLALLVGIRAGWAGYAGSLCIWLVANLPGFRHGMALQALWPALPLLVVGLLLLSADRRVRAMWRWVRQRLPWRRPDPGVGRAHPPRVKRPFRAVSGPFRARPRFGAILT